MSIRKLVVTLAASSAVTLISHSAMAEVPVQIPEPGSIGLTAFGLGLAFYIARRSRK